LINLLIPPLYIGPLSGLAPPNFVIGPNAGYVWTRFTITERPVPMSGWKGDGGFEDGESEDYLLLIDEDIIPKPDLECRGSITWNDVKPGTTVTDTFEIRNNGDPGSFLNWQITSWPTYGTWSFSPPSGTGLAPNSWITITATCVAPNQGQSTFTGDIIVCNSDDATDCCNIATSLTTPRVRAFAPHLFSLITRFTDLSPILKLLLQRLG